jgi:predicted transcriptional regulator
MVTEQLKYQILKDAEQQDLLPTALINKYDVSLEWLMEILKSLLNDGFLALTEGKWLRITEKGVNDHFSVRSFKI